MEFVQPVVRTDHAMFWYGALAAFFVGNAGACGVDVQVEIWHNLHHGWYLFANHIKATARTL